MTVSVDFPDDLAQYLAKELASGRYATEGELLADALRLHREQSEGRQALRAELLERAARADRGEFVEIDLEALEAEGRRRLAMERSGP
jgi:putative addiction module CopG family antidote